MTHQTAVAEDEHLKTIDVTLRSALSQLVELFQAISQAARQQGR